MFSKYNDPFRLLDSMIKCRMFSSFVAEVIRMKNEETEERTLWEFYLAKVEEKSFQEFRESVRVHEQKSDEASIHQTISDSRSILEGFRIDD